MKPIFKRLLITAPISLGLGAIAILPVVTSDNGYVAGYAFFPLLLLIGVLTFVLVVAGLIAITKKAGPILLMAAVLIPVGFFGAALVSKQLELGAYREDPTVPIVPAISDIVLFKQGTTEAQISDFWNETLATRARR